MRIGLLTKHFPPDIGGGQRYMFDIFSYLNKHHNVKVLAPRLKKIDFPVENSFLPTTPGFFLYSQLKKNSYFRNCDIICSGSAITAIFLKNMKQKKLSFVYGLDIAYPTPIYQKFFVRALHKMDHIVTCSNATKDFCIRKGLNKEKISVVYPRVDSKRFYPSRELRERKRAELGIKDEPVIFAIARHVEKKGTLYLVERLASKLVKQEPSLKILIGGLGPQSKKIKKAIKRLRLEKWIKFIGYIPGDDVISYYNAADVFLSPGRPIKGNFEGFGITHLEASACGIPIVGSRMDGAIEAIEPPVRGVVCDPYNEDEYVNATLKILRNEELRKKYAKRCRESVLEKWDTEISNKEFEEIIKRLVSVDN